LVAAQATLVVNVDFNGGTAPKTTYTGQGALVTADAHYWNGFEFVGAVPSTVSTNSLIASDGSTPTTVSVTLNNIQGLNMPVTLPAYAVGNALLDDTALNADYATDTPSTFTISGLTTNGQYALYFYGGAGKYGAGTQWVIGNTTNIITSLQPSFVGTVPPWQLGVDYTVFQVAADGSGVISGNWKSNLGAGNGGHFDGLQIEELVPEPSTLLLFGVGCAFLWRRIRRG
jgi:PEP-CTERM motif